MKKLGVWMFAGMLLAVAPAFSQSGNHTGQGRAVVTVLPKDVNNLDVKIALANLKVKVNGKESTVTGWKALRGAESPLELVLLIDEGASGSLGSEFEEINNFIKEMPADGKIAIAYMDNGRAVFSGPLTSDAAQLKRELHLPTGMRGGNGSPYFSLSDLAQRWPSEDRAARRAVIMISDGVDPWERRFDPEDLYVQTAIHDSVRAGLVVYSMYWHGRGGGSAFAGQNLLLQVAEATGGESYSLGTGNPVTLAPYFADVRRRLANQYALSIATERSGNKPEVAELKLHAEGVEAKITTPQQVLVE